MAGTHLISKATSLFAGAAYYERYHVGDDVAKSGLSVDLPMRVDFGAPLALDVNHIVDAATGAELPNAATKTYTTADDGTSPFDNADTPVVASVVMANGTTQSVWPLATPRNVSLNATHNSSLVAMTCLVTGYDVYGEAMSELLSITATGTDKTAAGKKAFKYIKSLAFVSAGDATANTANLGIGDVLGLPVRVDRKDRVTPVGNGALDASATLVVADDTSPATTTTGDVRGTVDFNTASDASKLFAAIVYPTDRSTRAGAFGVTQA